MLKEFKNFAMRGNVIDMAVGIIIGAAFVTIVKSVVDDILMPPLGLLLGNIDFTQFYFLLKEGIAAPPPYLTIADAKAAGAVTINYGMFLNNVISFLIVAFSVFMLIKGLNSLKRKEEVPAPAPNEKDCPYCFSKISINAVKCPACTSDLIQISQA
jgi:large conductance mechanosensitive channel